MIRYAGIGARRTPYWTQSIMRDYGRSNALQGMWLRSGGARGADQAFERGCDHVQGPKEIFLAEDATPEAFDHAAKFHPEWEKCDELAQALHARNSMIILGRDLRTPVQFVICWTPSGQIIGGTGQAIRIAHVYGIRVFNLGSVGGFQQLNHYVTSTF